MMPITVDCTACRRVIKVKDEFAGRKVRCPGCQATVAVPESEPENEFGDLLDDATEEPFPEARAKSKSSSRSKRGKKSASPWYVRQWHWFAALAVLMVALWPSGGLVIAMLIAGVGVLMVLVGGIVPFLRIIFGDPGTVLSLIFSRSARFEMMEQPDSHPYKKLVRTAFDPTRGLFWRGVLLMVMFIPAMIVNNGAKEWFRKRANLAAAPPPMPGGFQPGPAQNPNLPGGFQPGPMQQPNLPIGAQPGIVAPAGQGVPNPPGGDQLYYVRIIYPTYNGKGSVQDGVTAALEQLPGYKADTLELDEETKTIRFQHQGRPEPQSTSLAFSMNGFQGFKLKSSANPIP